MGRPASREVEMTFFYRAIAVVVLVFATLGAANAQDRATADQAKDLAAKAAVQVSSAGAASYDAFMNGQAPWVDRDLYIVVVARDGTILAHGLNKALVGKNLWEAKDPDGVRFIQEAVRTADANPNGGWYKLKFAHPQSRKIEPKENFAVKVSDVIVISGFYPTSN
jgi:cytochrome c